MTTAADAWLSVFYESALQKVAYVVGDSPRSPQFTDDMKSKITRLINQLPIQFQWFSTQKEAKQWLLS
ncbi:hypothetical protein V6R21_30390 [Limibacter armeniacum]